MSLTAIIVLLLVGLILLLLEVFVLPGTNIAGVIGILFIVLAIFFGYRDLEKPIAHIILFAALALTVATVWLGLRSNTWNRLSLHSTISSKVMNVEPDELQVGARGESITRLNPMGRVLINNKSFEAKSGHLFIDPHTPIEIVKIEGNQIIVKPIDL
ncbi:MAG: NfeD family protein [Salinivirgaceae bacterium]|nr:NfeD family protein [Salinivirgaceae bacterium]